jgi:hypothetical protein
MLIDIRLSEGRGISGYTIGANLGRLLPRVPVLMMFSMLFAVLIRNLPGDFQVSQENFVCPFDAVEG